nr:hypothetical protein [Candidatus Sigynarchaeum springense]
MTCIVQGMGEPGSPARDGRFVEGEGGILEKTRCVYAWKTKSARRAFLGRGSPESVHFGIGLPVARSFLHAIQYSPFASRNVIVAPALHQGQLICFSCFTTRVLVTVLRQLGARRARQCRGNPSMTRSMVAAGIFIGSVLFRLRPRVSW